VDDFEMLGLTPDGQPELFFLEQGERRAHQHPK